MKFLHVGVAKASFGSSFEASSSNEHEKPVGRIARVPMDLISNQAGGLRGLKGGQRGRKRRAKPSARPHCPWSRSNYTVKLRFDLNAMRSSTELRSEIVRRHLCFTLEQSSIGRSTDCQPSSDALKTAETLSLSLSPCLNIGNLCILARASS